MRPTKLSIKNIGIIADTIIEITKPLILFYGEVMQGKSTILNAIKWCFGGSFPQDIIRHGQDEASIELHFSDDTSIRRTFYRGKDQSTKARDVVFIRQGKPVHKPVTEIQRLLNPFQLNQNHLADMSETERKKYFLELFDVNTSDLDSRHSQLATRAQELRIKIKSYGDIDTTPVQPVDIASYKKEIARIREVNAQAEDEYRKAQAEVREHNENIKGAGEALLAWVREMDSLHCQIKETERKLTELKGKYDKAALEVKDLTAYRDANKEKPEPLKPALLSTAELEARVETGAAQNVRHEQYLERCKRSEQKTMDEESLLTLENEQRALRQAKLARLKEISDKCNVPGLVFQEDGSFTYNGTTAGMLSTSQLMELSSRLSAMYPPGFSLELIDRGESLGKSIFNFIDRAKAEDKAILATIVGEKPATVPAEVGVWVVENGNVSPQ